MSISNQSTASMALSPIAAHGGRPSSSGFVGVAFDKRTGCWQSYVTLATGKRKFVGRAPTVVAAVALRAAFIAEHGYIDPRAKAATATTGEAQQ